MSLAIWLLIGGAVGLFALMFGLQSYGYRRGKARAAESTDAGQDGLGIVEGAVFALLGLLLAFQFGGAAQRLSDRRDLAIQEANAIGTAYLRLDLLPAADGERLRNRFRQYVAARINTMEMKLDHAAASEQQRIAVRLQQEIWTDAVAVFAQQSDRSADRLVLPALNDMIDLEAERDAVGQIHAAIPVQVFLIALALIGAVLAGYSMSRSSRKPTLHMVLFAAVIATTIYCIFDMEFPRVGIIRIGVADQPLYDLRDALQ